MVPLQRVTQWLSVVLVIVLAAGCVGTAPSPASPIATPLSPSELSPDVRGVVTVIHAQNGTVTGLLVVGTKEADTTYDRARVGVTNTTRYFTKQQGQYVESAPVQLQVGQSVEVWFTGPRLTSSPIQGTAQFIAVIH
jgi:hypothetical protein